MGDGSTLLPGDLASLSSDLLEAVLSYLNLPPVGCYADRHGPAALGGDAAYELERPVRDALLKRRDALGGFKQATDLLKLAGFGPAELAALTDRLSDVGRYGNRLRPVWGGPESEREFFALVESATRYIHVSTYIIGGAAGLRLMEILARKRRAGVAVRLMFCASGFVISGSPSGTGFVSRFSELRSYLMNDLYVRKRIMRAIREHGIPFVNSSPVGRHWKRRDFCAAGVRTARDYYDRWARERGIDEEWLAEQERIDRECGLAFANVDHRKMILVDGERAFIGSQNVADSYFYSNELSPDPRVNVRKWQWHDSSAILEGGAVVELNRLFARRWMLSGGDIFDPEDALFVPPPRRVGHAVVTLATSIPGEARLPVAKNLPRFALSLLGADRRPILVGSHPIRERIRQLPKLARNEFLAAHCYPADGEILAHWAQAASDLGDFTLVVPLHYDTKVLGMECDRFYPEMMRAGAKLLGYDRAILHSKIAVADGWYTATGSSNLTMRSSRADLELVFLVQCRSFGAAVRERIRGDLADCRPLAPGGLARWRSRRSLPIFDAIVRYFVL